MRTRDNLYTSSPYSLFLTFCFPLSFQTTKIIYQSFTHPLPPPMTPPPPLPSQTTTITATITPSCSLVSFQNTPEISLLLFLFLCFLHLLLFVLILKKILLIWPLYMLHSPRHILLLSLSGLSLLPSYVTENSSSPCLLYTFHLLSQPRISFFSSTVCISSASSSYLSLPLHSI